MRRGPRLAVTILLLAVTVSAVAAPPVRDNYEPAPVKGMAEWDRLNLERNLRWILARERKAGKAKPRVGVFADAGVWHTGALSIVEALEGASVPCRVLDRSLLKAEVLNALEAVILPGGWAPFQWAAAGDAGLKALKDYVQRGGRCLGVCAGAYLLAREVRYDGKSYRYPLGLFDGTAKGPVPGLAEFPRRGPVKLTPTEAGLKRGLKPVKDRTFLFGGGPCFVGGTGVEVLARYADGTAAAVARPLGKGEVVLIGAHVERPAPDDGGDSAAPPAVAGALYKALVLPERK